MCPRVDGLGVERHSHQARWPVRPRLWAASHEACVRKPRRHLSTVCRVVRASFRRLVSLPDASAHCRTLLPRRNERGVGRPARAEERLDFLTDNLAKPLSGQSLGP